MIANCAVLGLDWTACSLSAYFEALVAYEEINDGKRHGSIAQPPSEDLKRFVKAHTVQ